MIDTPNRKITAAGLAGAAATLVITILGWTGLDPDAGFGAALATIFAFAAGYLVKDTP